MAEGATAACNHLPFGCCHVHNHIDFPRHVHHTDSEPSNEPHNQTHAKCEGIRALASYQRFLFFIMCPTNVMCSLEWHGHGTWSTATNGAHHRGPASRSSVWWTRWCCGRPWGCYCVGCGHVECPLRVAHMLRMAHNAGCNASVPRTRGIRDHFRGTASHVCMICRSLWFVDGRILLSREQQQQPCWRKSISSSP